MNPPSDDELLILKAGLLRGELAQNAYATWCSHGPIEIMTGDGVRLLGLLARNQAEIPHSMDDRRWTKIIGISRMNWTENQLRLATALRASDAIVRAGVEPMLLKGFALLDVYGGDTNARPFHDIEFMLLQREVLHATRALRGAGFIPQGTVPHRAATFMNEAGHHVHLQTVPFPTAPETFCEEMLHESSTIEVKDGALRVAGNRDTQMLVVLMNGVSGFTYPSKGWIADAFQLAKLLDDPEDALSDNGGTWEGLEARIREANVAPQAADGLRFLFYEFRVKSAGESADRLDTKAVTKNGLFRRLFGIGGGNS